MATCAIHLPTAGARFPFNAFELDETEASRSRNQRPAVPSPMPLVIRCAMERRHGILMTKGDLPDGRDGQHGGAAAPDPITIAARCDAELELRRERQRSAFALEVAGIGTWEQAIGDTEPVWSERMYRLRGLDPRDARSTRELAALVTDAADLEASLRCQQRLVEHGEAYAHDFPVRWPDGTQRWLARRAQVVRDAQGHAVSIAGVDFDITAQRRVEAAQRELAHAQRENRARSAFVTCLTHELRTPLNAVLGFGQLLLEDPGDPPTAQQRARLEHIRCAAGHMLALVNQTLDLASIEAEHTQPAAEPVALAECAQAAVSWVEPAARRAGVTVRADGLDGCVLADARRLRQVAANLVSNAVKYNRPGGWVVVQTRRRVHHGAEQCGLVVRDSGRGLGPEQMQRLFEPFNRLGAQREDIEGTGVGLAIARRLVQRMGGEVEVESQAGVGSEFRIWLPAAQT